MLIYLSIPGYKHISYLISFSFKYFKGSQTLAFLQSAPHQPQGSGGSYRGSVVVKQASRFCTLGHASERKRV